MDEADNTLFLRAARGEKTERPPVWLMRQAGRSDPAYRALRASVPLPLEQLFQTPDIAAQISLLPGRWGVDALIIFLDILSPLAPMGAPFIFRPGPQPATPLRTVYDFEALHEFDMEEGMPFVNHTFRLMRQNTPSGVSLLGFAGAPLTLLTFLAESGSPGSMLSQTRILLEEYPDKMLRVLNTLTNVVIDYLNYQLACGAHAVQLFESAACLFTRKEYLEFALPCQQRIFDTLKGAGLSIFFARLTDSHIPITDLNAAGADVLSLSSIHSIRELRGALGGHIVVQGNLNNQLLLNGPCDAIARAARACMEEGECHGHIFNLNHGVLPDTPHSHVTYLVDYVRKWKAGEPQDLSEPE